MLKGLKLYFDVMLHNVHNTTIMCVTKCICLEQLTSHELIFLQIACAAVDRVYS